LESGINIPDKHPGSYFKSLVAIFFGLKIIKFFVADPYPGFGAFLALDQGSGIRDGKLRIRDNHPESATLQQRLFTASWQNLCYWQFPCYCVAFRHCFWRFFPKLKAQVVKFKKKKMF